MGVFIYIDLVLLYRYVYTVVGKFFILDVLLRSGLENKEFLNSLIEIGRTC